MSSVGFSNENKRKRLVEDLEGLEYVGGENGWSEYTGRKNMLLTKDSAETEGKSEGSTSVKRRRKKRHLAIPADGYIWNKYGQKKIKGTSHMRNYYRCALYKSFGCLCKRTIDFDPQNSRNLSCLYIGEHNHNSVPVWGTIEAFSKNSKNSENSKNNIFAKLHGEKKSPFVKLENSLDFDSETDTDSIKKEGKLIEKDKISMGKEKKLMKIEGKLVEKESFPMGKEKKPIENEEKSLEKTKILKAVKLEEFQSADFEMKEGKENDWNNLNMEDLEDLDMNLPMVPNGNEGESFRSLEENILLLTPDSGTSENDFFNAFDAFPSNPTEWGEGDLSSQNEQFLVILESLTILESETAKKVKIDDFGEREENLLFNVVSNFDNFMSRMKSNNRSLQKNEISEGTDERESTKENSSLSVDPNNKEEMLTVTETSSCTSMLAPDSEWMGGVPKSQSYGSYGSTEISFPSDPISSLGGGDSLRVTDFMDRRLFLEEDGSDIFVQI